MPRVLAHPRAAAYYRGAQGIILVYDVTRAETFDSLADIWLREVRAALRGRPACTAGMPGPRCAGGSRCFRPATKGVPSCVRGGPPWFAPRVPCAAPASCPVRCLPEPAWPPAWAAHTPLPLPAGHAPQVDMYNTVEEGIKMVVANKTDLVSDRRARTWTSGPSC